MSQERVVWFVTYFAVFGTFWFLILAAEIKFFERSLAFRQALLIAGVTTFIGQFLLSIYYAAKPQLGITSRDVDGFVSLAAAAFAGVMITRLAANYGIKKTGWLGLGAKVMLGLIVVSLLFATVVLVLINVFR